MAHTPCMLCFSIIACNLLLTIFTYTYEASCAHEHKPLHALMHSGVVATMANKSALFVMLVGRATRF